MWNQRTVNCSKHATKLLQGEYLISSYYVEAFPIISKLSMTCITTKRPRLIPRRWSTSALAAQIAVTVLKGMLEESLYSPSFFFH